MDVGLTINANRRRWSSFAAAIRERRARLTTKIIGEARLL
jgi:hypothetical protein